jgi:hypothetical protein
MTRERDEKVRKIWKNFLKKKKKAGNNNKVRSKL